MVFTARQVCRAVLCVLHKTALSNLVTLTNFFQPFESRLTTERQRCIFLI